MNVRRRLQTWVARVAVCAAAAALLVALPTTVTPAAPAAAADGSQFNAGNIISDAAFYDSQALNAGGVQDFLNRQVASCQAGFTCLKNYRQNTDNRPADRYCDGYSGRANESAAEIVDRVARSCGISQKVLLVLLQKEQSLVTSTAPSAWAYSAATGQGCPDTAPCDKATAGFFYQVYYAARQYEIYRLTPTSWGYQAGRWNNILYHPESSRGCGSARVYIENQATAGLYIYTPYTPNAAALRNLYGTGDNCSAYGNRNFWRLYTDWFGSTANHSPVGGFNLEIERGIVNVRGWAIDPDDRAAALQVVVRANGSVLGEIRADDPRPDVGAAHPGAGDNHGIRGSFQVVGGETEVCVTVRNLGAGSDANFGCSTVQVETASPYGGTSVEKIAGGVRVTGWTLDTDARAPLDIHVYVDGKGSVHRADRARPDVGQAFPGFGNDHGIDVAIPTSVGNHEVCTYAINVGLGMNKLLGCTTLAVDQSADPVGAVEAVFAEPGGFRVRGWAVDPNSADPLSVHVYRGAAGTAIASTVPRDDIKARYPQASRVSGFDAHIPAPAGSANVCLYGINVGWGANAGLGCVPVEVRAGTPFGGIDTTVSGASVRMRGWTIDPDTTNSLSIHTYIDGAATVSQANVARPDVEKAYPGYGAAHGIDQTFELQPGSHEICAYGINVGAGTNALLGCRQVTIADRSPFGGTDVTVVPGGVRLRGWTIDPDTTASLDVHVYVDGVGAAVTRAAVDRPDIARAYPSAGAAHGIDVQLPMASGRHEICSYAINVGSGGNKLLGCQTATVG